MKYYLAYGSNLNREQMAGRCPGAEAVGRAVIEGYRLAFRRTYLTIEPAEGCSVPAGVYRISEENERALDRYEGYPRLYFKEEMTVPFMGYDASGEHFEGTIEAMVYIMNAGFPVQGPTEQYLEVCKTGYADFGLDLYPLSEAVARARAREEKRTYGLDE